MHQLLTRSTGPVQNAEPACGAPASLPPADGAEPALGVRGRPSGGGYAEGCGRLAVRLGRLLPTPRRTPFTFGYLAVLALTSLYARLGDADSVARLLQASSSDAAHLVRAPLRALFASALWLPGGLLSAYAAGLVAVLTALERRIGGRRTAAVFVLGHVLATLATEIPVALSVLAGHLPHTSLHRLDYGVSFGLLASVGALAWLLTPLTRTLVLGWVAVLLAIDLVEFADPLTDWGHPIALLVGLACRPLVRRAAARRARGGRQPVRTIPVSGAR
ncbi:rhomboid-like protein [Streptomyces sp. ODS05-4]|uniref:rhomboid-like protein n=1 Tax=Streptomyces sp. ODS05-4 TaxID=2944939 RepID=UPI00210B934A|nr:rhomboid-like protein [Streptomyces sp. ODS05-4]